MRIPAISSALTAGLAMFSSNPTTSFRGQSVSQSALISTPTMMLNVNDMSPLAKTKYIQLQNAIFTWNTAPKVSMDPMIINDEISLAEFKLGMMWFMRWKGGKQIILSPSIRQQLRIDKRRLYNTFLQYQSTDFSTDEQYLASGAHKKAKMPAETYEFDDQFNALIVNEKISLKRLEFLMDKVIMGQIPSPAIVLNDLNTIFTMTSTMDITRRELLEAIIEAYLALNANNTKHLRWYLIDILRPKYYLDYLAKERKQKQLKELRVQLEKSFKRRETPDDGFVEGKEDASLDARDDPRDDTSNEHW